MTLDPPNTETLDVSGFESEVEAVPTTEQLWYRRRPWRTLIEWFAIIAFALLAAFLMRGYVFETFSIPSGSMLPTLHVGDRIIVSKLSYEWGGVNRGDILVFRRPPTEHCGGPEVNDLVKRVIGLPGDHLYSVNNTIYVNGKVLQEPWTHIEPLETPIASPSAPVIVPPHSYFMMGDNRPNSCDSRFWGAIDRQYIVGEVVLRIWPLSRIGIL